MQTKVTLPSGHQLTINVVEYDAAKRLRQLVFAEFIKVHLSVSDGLIPALMSKDRNNILAALSGTEINTLKNLFSAFLASDEIEDQVIVCMHKWMLDGVAIKAETFHPDDRRGDLIPCAVEVGRHALLPFFAKLGLPSLSPGG